MAVAKLSPAAVPAVIYVADLPGHSYPDRYLRTPGPQCCLPPQEVCGEGRKCGKHGRLPEDTNTERFFPSHSVTLAARPGIRFLFLDRPLAGLCRLSSACLAGALWAGTMGTEAAQARVRGRGRKGKVKVASSSATRIMGGDSRLPWKEREDTKA